MMRSRLFFSQFPIVPELVAKSTTCIAGSDESGLVFRSHLRVACPPSVIVRPPDRCIRHLVWLISQIEQRQSQVYDLRLHQCIPGNAERIAEWQVSKQETRHAAVGNDVQCRADDHGGQAIGFQVTGGQTDGLMAHRSERDEEGEVRLILPAATQDLRGIPFECPTLAVFGGQTVKAVGQAAQLARLDRRD